MLSLWVCNSRNFLQAWSPIILKVTDVDQVVIVEYCGMYYGTTRWELFEMFRAEREFCSEYDLNVDVIIYLIDTSLDAAPTLDGLEIGLELPYKMTRSGWRYLSCESDKRIRKKL